MNFAVNPDKKRTWNYGWWHDWTQGKAAIGIMIIRHRWVQLALNK